MTFYRLTRCPPRKIKGIWIPLLRIPLLNSRGAILEGFDFCENIECLDTWSSL